MFSRYNKRICSENRLDTDQIGGVPAHGGGRGIRLVASPDDMVEGFERCAGESKAAFGDGSFTEQITGVDLVAAQLSIASGETLTSMGLAEQMGAPRGYAI